MKNIEDKTIEAIQSLIDFFADNEMVIEAKKNYSLNIDDLMKEAKNVYSDTKLVEVNNVLNRLLELNYLLSIFDISEIEVLKSEVNKEMIVGLYAISKIEDRNEPIFDMVKEYRSVDRSITSLDFDYMLDDLHSMINKLFEEGVQPEIIGFCNFMDSLLIRNYEYFIFLFTKFIAQVQEVDIRDFACTLLTYLNVNFDYKGANEQIGDSVYHTTILQLASSVESVENQDLYEYYRTNIDISLIVNAICILNTIGNNVTFAQIKDQMKYIDHNTMWNKEEI